MAVCFMWLAGVLGGIVWAGWRHVPQDRAVMLALAGAMATIGAVNFVRAVAL